MKRNWPVWLGLAALGLIAGVGWWRSALEAPEPTLLLLDRHGEFLAQSAAAPDAGYGWWRVEPVPERVAAAIVAIEDRRFESHLGLDPLALGRAIWERVAKGHHSGASTIAMQVARMQNPGPRNVARKMMEAVSALAITLRHGRVEVLRHYLRLVPFGNGSHGIAHAARWYLDKPVADLSWAEIAFLAAIPQSPAKMNPYSADGKARAIRRGHRILAALQRDGLLGDEEFTLAQRQIETIAIPARGRRPSEALHAALRIAREVAHARRPDPRIVTTLDLGIQRRVAGMATHALEEWRERGAEQLAVVVLDRSSRAVLAWLGSGDYFSSAAGAIDFAGIRRSPGSALKPFLYALALERGRIDANTILADLPDTVWGIENADHDYLGPMLPRQALANSRNVPAAAVLRQVGLEDAYGFLGTLGLHDNRQPAGHFGLVMAVGALPTTLERLVRAYGALADDGRLAELAWWEGQQRPAPRPVMRPATARLVTNFLADPAARLPAFPRLAANPDGVPIAVKTGTSQGYRDAWAVAWTDTHLVGVWTGRARGNTMRAVTGAQSAAHLAQDVLLALHRESGPGFPLPEGFRPVSLCAQTGLRDSGRCAQTLVEWFAAGQLPQEDDVFQLLRIDLRNGLLAAPWTPPAMVGERTFATLPPAQAAWGEAHALAPAPLHLSPLDRPGSVIPRERGGGGAGLAVAAPRDGLRMLRSPETPEDSDFLNLRAVAGPGLERVLWLVDGQPFRLAGPRESVRWPLVPGTHRFVVATPDMTSASRPVSIQVE